MIVSPSWTPSSKMPLQAYPHHASPLLSIHRDQLYSQVAAWFGRSLAVTLAMVSIHLSFQQYLGGEEAAASNEMSMIFKSYWRNTFDASMYGSSAVLTLLFCSTFFALLYGSRRLGSHPLCVPALLLITRLHIFLVTLGLVPQRSFVSEQAGYFALHLDGLRDALLPSIGMPLTWPSQLLLRLVFEALQAAYMFRIVRTDIRATALIFAARFSVSASVGFVCDLLQRRSFLQSEAAAKQDYALANPAVDHNGGAERPFDTAPPSRSLSMTSFGGSTFSEPRPTLELDPSVVYNDTGVSVTRVVLKSSHTDEDAPLPVFEKAELHTRIINEGFTSYSMSLVSVSVRRGCFIVEVVMAKKPESIVKIDCLQALQTLQLEKHLKVGSKVSIRVEESQLGQVFKLGQDKRWDRISIAPPPTAFPQLSLALTPRASSLKNATRLFFEADGVALSSMRGPASKQSSAAKPFPSLPRLPAAIGALGRKSRSSSASLASSRGGGGLMAASTLMCGPSQEPTIQMERTMMTFRPLSCRLSRLWLCRLARMWPCASWRDL